MDKYTKQRLFLIKTYGPLYQQHYYVDDKFCFYCGDHFDVKDHCPPLVWAEALCRPNDNKRKHAFWTVNSCKHCNAMLGGRYLPTIFDRSNFIVTRLEQKYETRATLWAPEELKEMSEMFQSMIIARQTQAKELLSRIRHAQWRVLQTDTFPLTDFD
jgi:hypothetical protein